MLHEPRHGEVLRQEGILYAPDYVVNAAGIINVSVERLPGGYDEDAAMGRINRIADNLREVFELAEAEVCRHEPRRRAPRREAHRGGEAAVLKEE